MQCSSKIERGYTKEITLVSWNGSDSEYDIFRMERQVIIVEKYEKSILQSMELACLARARAEGLISDMEYITLSCKINDMFREEKKYDCIVGG